MLFLELRDHLTLRQVLPGPLSVPPVLFSQTGSPQTEAGLLVNAKLARHTDSSPDSGKSNKGGWNEMFVFLADWLQRLPTEVLPNTLHVTGPFNSTSATHFIV
ncbi:unnamed protein product [Protopolystoma xenopodis]|uniref:Uncharacterized protein n=1 Tax=Protopolystoma xenopodis TaxID=117903 RepID=A0A3S5CER1_9PLAT|nr:unnamed protein product [Protopolystoma xenopodis]